MYTKILFIILAVAKSIVVACKSANHAKFSQQNI